jgi:hypothetical protein
MLPRTFPISKVTPSKFLPAVVRRGLTLFSPPANTPDLGRLVLPRYHYLPPEKSVAEPTSDAIQARPDMAHRGLLHFAFW